VVSLCGLRVIWGLLGCVMSVLFVLPAGAGSRTMPAPARVPPAVSRQAESTHRVVVSAAVYEYGCQVPSGVFSGGADRPRRRPRAGSPSRPCSLPEHSFAAALPSPQVGGGRRRKNAPPIHPQAARWAVQGERKRLRPAGVRLGPGARPERPSIRGGPTPVPSTLYRIRSGRPARRNGEPTHRTNGAFTGSPGGTTAALTDRA